MTTKYYVAQEKAMAPGIVKDWPEIILLPKNKNGRLKKVDEKLCLIIAEAFNVYTETSLTPRQLDDQRRELFKSLSEIVDYHYRMMPDFPGEITDPNWSQVLPENLLEKAEKALALTKAKGEI